MKLNFKFDKRFFIIFFSILFIFFIMLSVRWTYHSFRRVNLDEIGIIINSGFGVGTDPHILWSFIKKVVIRSVLFSFIVAVVCQIFRTRFVLIATYVILVGLLIQKVSISNVQIGSFFSYEKSNFYETEFTDPRNTKINWTKHRNIVFIALESIEKVYGTTQISNEILTPNITKLEKENISFEKYHSISGLSHTIAAITGFTTGLPMFYTSFTNMDKMVGAYGLGSIFKEAGYQTWSIFPATGRFSLKSKFMNHMGFENVLDGEYIRANIENPPPEKPFDGVDDGTLFEYSKPIIKDIVKSGKPYFIFMETINTHLKGYFTEYCKNIGFKQETMEDITKCDDKIIYDFVQWMRKQDPTAVIVLVNDHKQHSGPMMQQLNKISDRPLANVFINTDVFNGVDMNRPVSAMDFFPTVVEVAGGKIEGCKLGLGTSLSNRCKNVQTLRERFIDSELEKQLEQKNDLYYKLSTGKEK